MEREVARGDAREALAGLAARQRLLRGAYTAARYGWPETAASEWARRPERFAPAAPSCRATTFLTALTHHG